MSEAATEISGLELMKIGVQLADKLPPSGMATIFPMKIEDAQEGMVCFSAQADQRHTNVMGSVHGGFAAVSTHLDAETNAP